ncbi:aromatic ring-hydroxylating oxygenase subunit alpha [Tardibacter chloracetimidivorans]|uniref:aromatic ring-hydroxylating oxygenase subunit alpha n=1 Tax=Tardibacter chloracetimidivorans TaxID=1921510 RepID=UPI001D04F1C1|nr:aromatic ring-hydroxylating dioxygenase subunit alpha [Tardibacter chloracetimidivorans]
MHRSAYVDPEIFAAEKERIFNSSWLYVGHLSEIDQPGDFVTRRVAGRDLVLSRDSTGVMRCFLNACPHRGAKIVREKTGNARSFTCIYHAWQFNNAGKLIGLNGPETYAPDFKADPLHQLQPVPLLDEYRGLVFVNFDAGAQTLREYLAGATEFLDLIMDQSQERMVLIGGVQEYAMRANWKLLAENAVDVFHLQPLHPTYFDMIGALSGSQPSFRGLKGEAHYLGNGHTVVEMDTPAGRPIAKWMPGWGEESKASIERVYADLVRRFGEERAFRIANRNRNLVLFPNLVINDHISLTIRCTEPVAPDAMDVTVWGLAPEEEASNTVAVKRRLTSFIEFLGPGGFATPDDIEALELCQKGFANMREAPWNDVSKGMVSDTASWMDEGQMRYFWLEWQNRLLSNSKVAA